MRWRSVAGLSEGSGEFRIPVAQPALNFPATSV